MKPLINFTKEEWVTLLGIFSKLTKDKMINFVFNDKMHTIRSDKKTTIRQNIDKICEFAKNKNLNFRDMYLMAIILQGNHHPKYTSAIYDLYGHEEYRRIFTRFQKASTLRECIDQLIKLGMVGDLYEHMNFNRLKLLETEHVVMLQQHAIRYLSEIK